MERHTMILTKVCPRYLGSKGTYGGKVMRRPKWIHYGPLITLPPWVPLEPRYPPPPCLTRLPLSTATARAPRVGMSREEFMSNHL